MQGLSVGYITERGIALEGGVEFSAVNDVYVGIRYIHRMEKLTLWPFVGIGAGSEIGLVNFSDTPPEAKLYNGPDKMGFLTAGLMIPVVDVGIKAEVRGIFYGMSRISLVTGIHTLKAFSHLRTQSSGGPTGS